MKILHTVQLYEPAVGGSEEVVKQISQRLAQRGHDVTVATAFHPKRTSNVINGVKIQQFQISGNGVLGISGEQQRYQKFLLQEKFDLILNYGTQVWSTDLIFPLLKKIKAKRVLVPLGFEGLHKAEYREYYRTLPEYLKLYDQMIYLSAHYQDKQFIEKQGIHKGIVIPNAASEDEFLVSEKAYQELVQNFRKKYRIRTPYIVLTVSNHYLLKRHYFLIDAWRKLKRKDVSLVIIGKNPAYFSFFSKINCFLRCKIKSALFKDLLVLDDISRADTVAAFQAADLFLLGSQFECSPLVIFEAMASKTPFVSTDCGNVRDFEKYGSLIANPDEMAEKIEEWLSDEKRRKKVGEAAQKNWLAHFTWEKITDQYEALYRRLTR